MLGPKKAVSTVWARGWSLGQWQHRRAPTDRGGSGAHARARAGWGVPEQLWRTFKVPCFQDPDWQPKGQRDRALWLLFHSSSAVHSPHLRAICSFQKDSSWLHLRRRIRLQSGCFSGLFSFPWLENGDTFSNVESLNVCRKEPPGEGTQGEKSSPPQPACSWLSALQSQMAWDASSFQNSFASLRTSGFLPIPSYYLSLPLPATFTWSENKTLVSEVFLQCQGHQTA